MVEGDEATRWWQKYDGAIVEVIAVGSRRTMEEEHNHSGSEL